MAEFKPQAIAEISDPTQIRVMIWINDQMVHVPLTEVLKSMQVQIDALKVRVTALGG